MRVWGLAFVMLLTRCPAHGYRFVVDNSNDTTGLRSLRGAIIEANRLGGANTIALVQTNYVLTIPGIDENGARTGDLDVTNGSLTIAGLRANVTIDASNLGDRVFHVLRRGRLTLVGVTLKGGSAFGGDYGHWAHVDGEAGGAIYNSGVLTLRNCRIFRNSSGAGGTMLGNGPGGEGGAGGGIYNEGLLTMDACVIEENSSGPSLVSSFGGNGGGIYNAWVCTLNDCSIVGNSSGSGGMADTGSGFGGTGGNGGGIYNAGRMYLNRCTINGNYTGSGTDGNLPGWSGPWTGGSPGGNGGDGAGVHNSGRLEMNLCTVSGNTNGNGGNGGTGNVGGSGGLGGSGAGILNVGSLVVDSCTISFNCAGRGGNGGNSWAWGSPSVVSGAQGGGGGGIVCGSGAAASLRNSLVALNSTGEGGLAAAPGPKGVGADLNGAFLSQGYNLIGDAEGSSGLTNGVIGNIAGTSVAPVDPLLGPLRNNGGLALTHALLPGSPAIDQGKRSRYLTDQRGHRRPIDFTSIPNTAGGDGTDIGAFELDVPVLSVSRQAKGAVLSWDSSFTGFRLEATTNRSLSGWTPVSGSAGTANGECHVTNNAGAGFQLFRLRRN
jgi:hypothetical protein